MKYRLRETKEEDKFCQKIDIKGVTHVMSIEDMQEAIAVENVCAKRKRKLNMVVVLVIVCMNMYTYMSIGHVMQKMFRGLRLIWSDPDYEIVGDSAFSYRR